MFGFFENHDGGLPNADFVPSIIGSRLPASADLRAGLPAAYDRLTLPASAANAIASLGQFLLAKEGKHAFLPSRLFLHYNGMLDDEGTLRGGLHAAAALGMPDEKLWWYNPDKAGVLPSTSVYTAALKHRVADPMRIAGKIIPLRSCLAEGYPFAFTVDLHGDLEPDASGLVPMPGVFDTCSGRLSALAVGYDIASDVFIVRESRGPGWGMAGHCLLPTKYVLKYGVEFWTARKIA